ncbi:uncharacterized protein LAESUDRAFT_718590, partial [Laetiporus sulphureus 93-53]
MDYTHSKTTRIPSKRARPPNSTSTGYKRRRLDSGSMARINEFHPDVEPGSPPNDPGALPYEPGLRSESDYAFSPSQAASSNIPAHILSHERKFVQVDPARYPATSSASLDTIIDSQLPIQSSYAEINSVLPATQPFMFSPLGDGGNANIHSGCASEHTQESSYHDGATLDTQRHGIKALLDANEPTTSIVTGSILLHEGHPDLKWCREYGRPVIKDLPTTVVDEPALENVARKVEARNSHPFTAPELQSIASLPSDSVQTAMIRTQFLQECTRTQDRTFLQDADNHQPIQGVCDSGDDRGVIASHMEDSYGRNANDSLEHGNDKCVANNYIEEISQTVQEKEFLEFIPWDLDMLQEASGSSEASSSDA